VYEYPTDVGDPYYPVPQTESANVYRRYKLLADNTPEVHFVGRLATYKYYNMDQCVAQALSTFDEIRGAKKHVTRRAAAAKQSAAASSPMNRQDRARPVGARPGTE
jgi:hypothetical protein